MYDREPGYLRLFLFRGVPVYFHWSFPIAGIIISLYGRAGVEETIYYILSCSLLIFIHELGHLIAATYSRLKVHAMKVSGAGGMCLTEIPTTIGSAFLLFSGGLMAQAIVFAFTVTYLSYFSYPENKLGFCLVMTFTLVNVIVFVINIIPSKNPRGQITDGYVLWSLFWEWRRQA